MYLLDTNIVSVLDGRHREYAAHLLPWLRTNAAHLHLSVVTALELETGILKLERDGISRRSALLRVFTATLLPSFGDRLLPVDLRVATRAAVLAERALPTQPETPDLLIAATADVHGLTVLTRNLRHFQPTGIPCRDPFEGLPRDV